MTGIMKLQILCAMLLLVACGINVYESVASKKGDRYYIEEARIHVDKGEYAEAREALTNVEHITNDKLLLDVAVNLGESGLSIWKIILEMVDNKTLSSGSGTGVDRIFNLLNDSVFGTGTTRTLRLASLSNSIQALKQAEDSGQVKNLRCFLAGMLVVPRITEGTQALDDATDALENIQQSAVNGGSDATNCPNLTDLTTPLNVLIQVQTDLAEALALTEGCSFLNFSSASSLNEIQKRLQKFKTNANAGCTTTPDCQGNKACEALKLTCVQQAMSSPTAAANDDKVEVCELLQNCRTPGSCF